MKLMPILQLMAGAFFGNMLAEKFILRQHPTDPTGFVTVADGIGWDDAARAGSIALVTIAIRKVMPS